jgi:RNA polymerase sigma factor for flagellar operon FliA
MRQSGEQMTELTYTADGTIDRVRCVTEYAPMVKRIARYMLSKLPASVQLDDLVQAGMIGLMEAYSRYEESQGIQFEAYATQRIRGAMLDELRQNDWLPRATRKTLRDIEAAMHRVQQRVQRAATEREIATEMGVTLADYQTQLQNSKGYQLLHYDELGDGEDPFLDHNLPDSREDPLERLHDKRFRASVVAAIEQLPERDRLLMGLYYEQELNFREIAEVLGVTESRVCQIHTQAVARIRSQLRNW